MGDATDPRDLTTRITTREWVRAAAWIGGILLAIVLSIVVLYNLALCGCETRPASLVSIA